MRPPGVMDLRIYDSDGIVRGLQADEELTTYLLGVGHATFGLTPM